MLIYYGFRMVLSRQTLWALDQTSLTMRRHLRSPFTYGYYSLARSDGRGLNQTLWCTV